MAARWSTAEDQLLWRLHGEQLPINEIAARIARSADAVVARRQTLGIAARLRSMPWSIQEEALQSAATAAGVPVSSLAVRLGRSTDQVRTRRRALVGPRTPVRPYLTHEDLAIRLCLLERGDLAALADRLGRSPDAVRLHARQLGLYRPAPRPRWADWEDTVIRDGYTSALPCAQIACQLPHRTSASVAARACKLGLVTHARRWSTRDDQQLGDLAARGATLEYAAQRLGRTPEAIRRRADRGQAPRACSRRPSRPPLGPQEDELLRLHHALSPAVLAQLLDRSDAAVCRRLCSLGLRRRAKRSPHHPISRFEGRPTPGEPVMIAREFAARTPADVWRLSAGSNTSRATGCTGRRSRRDCPADPRAENVAIEPWRALMHEAPTRE